jgi:hypothetical protein
MLENITNIPSARVPILEPASSLVSREWYRYFNNQFGAVTNAINLSAGDTGSVPYQTAPSSTTFLPIGTASQFMRVNAGATAPEWATGAAISKTNDTNVTLTLGGDFNTALLSPASFTLDWAGELSAARGGTGFGSYTVGDVLYASTATALDKLSAGTIDYALVSNGAAVAPSYKQISLTAGVTGTLPIANGGTSSTTATGTGAVVLETAPTISNLTVTGTGGNVYSSTYTPTLTNSTNVAASTTGACQYMRVGNVVTVSGQISVDPTAAAVLTVLLISLPIASTFSSSRSAGGSAASISNIYGEVGGILGNTTTDEFELRLLPSSLANQSYAFQATYLIQ